MRLDHVSWLIALVALPLAGLGACSESTSPGAVTSSGGSQGGSAPTGAGGTAGVNASGGTSGAQGGGSGSGVGGASACVNGLSMCAVSCVDLLRDPANCGQCGMACPAGQACVDGSCGASCATHLTRCELDAGARCVDTNGSEEHCGACNQPCATGLMCVDGLCGCVDGAITCDEVCYDPLTDLNHCGECNNTCSGSESCVLGDCLDPTSTNCGAGVEMDRTSEPAATIVRNKLYINNNLWGDGAGTQSIWGTCQQGDLIGWGTEWDHPSSPAGVKSYASAVFGWHWGYVVENTGLPMPLADAREVRCGWSFTPNPSGSVLNVSYDVWLHNIPNADWEDDPEVELMIWLYTAGSPAPISEQATVSANVGGHAWTLHQGAVRDEQNQPLWNVFTYVHTTGVQDVTLNIKDFTRDLESRGLIQSGRHLSSVQAGTEVYAGQGSLVTNGFYCRIE